MSMFICSRCGKRMDADFSDCVEDPDNQYELMCIEHEEDKQPAIGGAE